MGLPASGCTDRPTDRAVGDQIGVVVGSSGDLVAEERVVVPASRRRYPGTHSHRLTRRRSPAAVSEADPAAGRAWQGGVVRDLDSDVADVLASVGSTAIPCGG